ncbi:MAG: class I SAM-dependent methyltransferase [Planctomycetes bacterium]|nr:class I SAM-dependent methyltransferase [Planctomycetota bacterium]
MYDQILASIHDRWFDSIPRGAAAHIRNLWHGRKAGRIVDIGCGSGVLLEAVAQLASQVVGIDLSPEMVSLGRTRLPGAQWRVGHALQVDVPAADVVVAVGEILSYAAADAGFRISDLANCFARIKSALTAEGVWLFDVLGAERDYSGTFFRDEPEFTVTSVVKQQGDIVERHIVSFLKVAGEYRKSVETHRLRTFSAPTLETMLTQAGLSWKRLTGYADVMLFPGRIGYECRPF